MVMRTVRFTVPGPPKGKARARTVRTRGGQTFSYTPEGTVLYENLIKISFSQTGERPFEADQSLHVSMTAYYPIPKSTSRKKKEEMIAGHLRPAKKPDIDNIIKSILDALNGVAYHDDTQVVAVFAEKYYSDTPRVEVEIGNM